MLHTFWNNVHLARPKTNRAVSHLDIQVALQDKKEIVGFVVFMPNELALDFNHHHVHFVELRDCAWRPVVGKRSQLFREIDFVLRKQSYLAFFSSITITAIGFLPTTASVCMVPGLLAGNQ